MQPKLRADNLRFRYSNDETASWILDGVSFGVDSGSLLAIVGASGCGKSTLLGLLAGFLQPVEGRILLDDVAVNRPGPSRTLVPQGESLFRRRSALTNVLLGIVAQGHSKQEATRRASEALEAVGMGGFGDKFPNQLSGGQRQRVALARALAVSPEVLLLDEPFASLDWHTRQSVYKTVNEVRSQTGQTTILVTHDLDEAIRLADSIAVLDATTATLAEVATGIRGISDVEQAELRVELLATMSATPTDA